MSFIWKVNGLFYLAEKQKNHNSDWRTKILRRATEEEIKCFLEQHKSNVVYMICDNPFCDNRIRTTRKRKIKLNTEDPQKGKLEFVYCGKKCRDEHLAALKR